MVIQARYPGTCRKCGQPIRVGDAIDWAQGAGATHVVCPAQVAQTTSPAAQPAGAITWSQGEGYGGDRVEPGTVVRHEGQIVTITSCRSRYYREDGMSFGVGDDQGHVYAYTARLATEAEAAPVEHRERVACQRQEARARLDAITKRSYGWELPQAGTFAVEGETVIAASVQERLYGGGTSWVISAEYIYRVVGNSADGDAWANSNWAGSIVRRTPYDEALAGELRQIAQTLQEERE